MNKKRKLHDGIVGIIITGGVALGWLVNPLWFYFVGFIGVLLIQSAFTGFCPVYYTLDKLGIPEHTTAPYEAS